MYAQCVFSFPDCYANSFQRHMLVSCAGSTGVEHCTICADRISHLPLRSLLYSDWIVVSSFVQGHFIQCLDHVWIVFGSCLIVCRKCLDRFMQLFDHVRQCLDHVRWCLDHIQIVFRRLVDMQKIMVIILQNVIRYYIILYYTFII